MRTIDVLDAGHVSLVESWGSDERIVEAARMSTGKGFLGWGPRHADTCPYSSEEAAKRNGFAGCNCREDSPGDEKLLRYLWEHKHLTPFEMAGMVIEVQAPIFVFREWHRHRTQSYNEMSARYVPLPDMNYMPSVERLMQPGGSNKQAQGTGAALTEDGARVFRAALQSSYEDSQECYRWSLEQGVPKELARLMLPVARYSRMRASANLRNWLAFLTLRMDAAAQWEIRQYANAVGSLICYLFPRTWELFRGELFDGDCA